MRNERDWREQIHFGREEAVSGGLRGPNLWPPDAAWRLRTLGLLSDLELAGREILAELAVRPNLPPLYFLAQDEDPYLLLKMILYQAPPSGTPRSGVAPHVDFSWITLLVQDDTGGLEVRAQDGDWIDVPPIAGVLVVNVGEILEFASRGHYRATPHRVVNRSADRSRVSLPFFLNPSLDTLVEPAQINAAPEREPDKRHVHRVFSKSRNEPFIFGEQEWRRKGLGIWCTSCVSG
jgi:isopenicillin N synthase-like dioxygenase